MRCGRKERPYQIDYFLHPTIILIIASPKLTTTNTTTATNTTPITTIDILKIY